MCFCFSGRALNFFLYLALFRENGLFPSEHWWVKPDCHVFIFRRRGKRRIDFPLSHFPRTCLDRIDKVARSPGGRRTWGLPQRKQPRNERGYQTTSCLHLRASLNMIHSMTATLLEAPTAAPLRLVVSVLLAVNDPLPVLKRNNGLRIRLEVQCPMPIVALHLRQRRMLL